jgi:hypothetical protein
LRRKRSRSAASSTLGTVPPVSTTWRGAVSVIRANHLARSRRPGAWRERSSDDDQTETLTRRGRVVEHAHAGRVPLLSLQPPPEPGAGVGDGVDRLELRHEARHHGVAQGSEHPANVDLGQLVHGPLVSGHRGSYRALAFARSRRYAWHPMQGTLEEGVLPLVLRTVYVERKTGPLHVTRGEERASVCFTQGNIVYGQSNIKECHLGETLVRHALLTEWDLERARDGLA